MECADQYLKYNGNYFKKCIYCDATVDLVPLIQRQSNYNIDFLTMSYDTRRISCINKDCRYEGSQNDILRHLELCDYTILKCKGCFQKILRKDMSFHMNNCAKYIQCGVCKLHCLREEEYARHLYECHKIVECVFCNDIIDETDLMKHSMEECNYRPVECKECHLSIGKQEEKSHLMKHFQENQKMRIQMLQHYEIIYNRGNLLKNMIGQLD
jgi:hypothetical protein